MRLVYEKGSFKLIGINAFGIRLRHEICDRWIREGFDIFQVMKNLGEANFDPEFNQKFEDDIIVSFNRLGLGEEVKVLRDKNFFVGIFN